MFSLFNIEVYGQRFIYENTKIFFFEKKLLVKIFFKIFSII